MEWSFSQGATFDRCPRQWFYKYRLANANAKREPERREAYLLSKLGTVWAWRGKVVDGVISRYVVRALQEGYVPSRAHLLAVARRTFDRQLRFATRHGLRDPDLKVSAVGDDFAAFLAVEEGGQISDGEIEKAWSDVEIAISNLLIQETFLDTLRSAQYLVAQRNLRFELALPRFGSVYVRAVPDLIAFFRDAPPMIVDWKVMERQAADYRMQLATYALALTRGRPHRDFPEGIRSYSPTNLRLLEVQLQLGKIREYALNPTDVAEVEDFVYRSVSRITQADGNDASHLSSARYSGTCKNCGYKAICWEAD